MEEKNINTTNLSRAINRILALISGKSGSDHNHDGVYAAADHNHDGVYAPANHSHDGESAVDVTDKIALSWNAATGTGTNLEELSATPVEYKYIPSLGIVFFMIDLQYRGSMAEAELIQFIHVGGYKPKECGPFSMTSTADIGKLVMRYETIDDETKLWIIPTEAIGPTGMIRSNYLTGWYFCDGE